MLESIQMNFPVMYIIGLVQTQFSILHWLLIISVDYQAKYFFSVCTSHHSIVIFKFKRVVFQANCLSISPGRRNGENQKL